MRQRPRLPAHAQAPLEKVTAANGAQPSGEGADLSTDGLNRVVQLWMSAAAGRTLPRRYATDVPSDRDDDRLLTADTTDAFLAGVTPLLRVSHATRRASSPCSRRHWSIFTRSRRRSDLTGPAACLRSSVPVMRSSVPVRDALVHCGAGTAIGATVPPLPSQPEAEAPSTPIAAPWAPRRSSHLPGERGASRRTGGAAGGARG